MVALTASNHSDTIDRSMSAPGLAIPATFPRRKRNNAWIESPLFDLSFFVLSPILSFLVIFGARLSPLVPVAVTMFLGFPHYYSTFTFYFWDEYRDRHIARWLVFFGGPILIVAATIVAFTMKLVLLYSAVIYVWTAIHVSRQSSGLLSIYRHRSGRPDPVDKHVANAAILSLNLWFTIWNLQTYPLLYRWVAIAGPWLPRAAWTAFAAAGVISSALLVGNLWRRSRSGTNKPTLAEIAFILISVAMFHPYLWVSDPALATLGMLAGHFVQYLGIVWLLHRRKFVRSLGRDMRRPLAAMSASIPVLIASLTVMSLITLAVYFAAVRLSRAMIFEVGSISIVFIHYYLDGFFWAFRDPQVRKTLGPYLTDPPPAWA